MTREEQYVTFGTAKLLKEKGFDWEVSSLYGEEGDVGFSSWSNNYNAQADLISAPTQQMACSWLLKQHRIFISIGVGADMEDVLGYMPSIYFLNCMICNKGKFLPNVDADPICDFTPQTPEEAIEAALEYALKNLI